MASLNFNAPPSPPTGPGAVDPAIGDDAAYQALCTHDSRFDGRIFVGVLSTGIYCRPVCKVRRPLRENCRFYANAASAERAGFRPCLRCRPELAPGHSLTDSSAALANAGARLIEQRLAHGQEKVDMASLAAGLGVTDRHFRRIFRKHLGVSPQEWCGTRRLLLAKALLTDTRLPITEVAEAAGFQSVRRFNTAVRTSYRLTPTEIRQSGRLRGLEPSTPCHLRLSWRGAYDTQAMQSFWQKRLLVGVEALQGDDGYWRRTLSVGQTHLQRDGWIGWKLNARRGEVELQFSDSLAPALAGIIAKLRHALDLDADPDDISTLLRPQFPFAWPEGLRVPGCFDGFETTIRIILGQQVSVAAACTLAGRLVARFGQPLKTPWAELTHLFPKPTVLAHAPPDSIGELGIVKSRIAAIKAVASAVASGELALEPGAPLAPTLATLKSLPGIGEWTCQLVALRVLAWPDAFPATDMGVIKALKGERPPSSLSRSEAWSPWRSYATMGLWQTLETL